MSALLALLLSLVAPFPCQTWDLQDDASLICDGESFPEGSYVLQHDSDDGDIMGASAWRSWCSTPELCLESAMAESPAGYFMSAGRSER